MSEFTIRNKAKNPIATLRPAVLSALLASRPESSSLVLTKFFNDYKSLTGKPIHVDHEQHRELLSRYGADERGAWQSKFSAMPAPWFHVAKCFVDGFLLRTTSAGLLSDLAIAEAFYDLLERQLQAANG